METVFYGFFSMLPQPSAWNKFPNEKDPLARYKFTSVEVNFSADQQNIKRSTYSLLDCLGDMGGLLRGLYVVGMIVMRPLANFALSSQVLSSLFRFRGSNEALLARTNTNREFKF